VRDIADGLDRDIERHMFRDGLVLDHAQDELRGTDLQVGREFAHVRVAEDQM
jgi:hypothetical protein